MGKLENTTPAYEKFDTTQNFGIYIKSTITEHFRKTIQMKRNAKTLLSQLIQYELEAAKNYISTPDNKTHASLSLWTDERQKWISNISTSLNENNCELADFTSEYFGNHVYYYRVFIVSMQLQLQLQSYNVSIRIHYFEKW